METPNLHPINVRIQNFQSIDDLKIEIRGFTCITGKTNIGKSAIIRAISKSILNDPVVGLVRKGKNHASVAISHDTWEFLWEKGEKGINRYHVGDKKLDKTGQKQIEEIKNIGFSSIKIGDEEIQPWFADQFFPIFLLNKSGPQITNFISNVSGLNVLQDAIVLASRGRKRLMDEIKIRNKDLDLNKQELTKYEGLEILQAQVQELKEQRRSAGELFEKIELSKSILVKIKLVQSDIKEQESMTLVRIPKISIESDIKKYSEASKINHMMRSVARDIIDIQKKSATDIPEVQEDLIVNISKIRKASSYPTVRRECESLEKAILAEIPNVVHMKDELEQAKRAASLNQEARELANQISRIKSLPEVPDIEVEPSEIAKWKRISELSVNVKAVQEQIDEEKRVINSKNQLLDELEEELRKIPTCSTCGQIIKDKSHNHKHPPKSTMAASEVMDLDI